MMKSQESKTRPPKTRAVIRNSDNKLKGEEMGKWEFMRHMHYRGLITETSI